MPWLFADTITDPGGTVAIIAAITAMLVAVGGLLLKFTASSEGRVDRISAESMASMEARRLAAEQDAARARTEMERARTEMAAAFEERNRCIARFEQQSDLVMTLRVTIAEMLAASGPPRNGDVG